MSTMVDAGATWTLGVKVGLPIACAGTLVLLVLAAGLVAYGRSERNTPYGDAAVGYVLGTVAFIAAIVVVVSCLFGYYPYGAEYHQYRDVSGTVSRIGSRFVTTGDSDNPSTTQRFVITLAGSGQQYAIDDTRAALLHKGDAVHIRCIREHDSGSDNDGYACKWGQP